MHSLGLILHWLFTIYSAPNLTKMDSLDAHTCNETIHSNSSSNRPGSAENSHSPSVQHEAAARHQHYESIVDTRYEQLIAQYEAVHENTLVHMGEVPTQVIQLEGRPNADGWVNNVDSDGYWLVLDGKATQVNQLEGGPTLDR